MLLRRAPALFSLFVSFGALAARSLTAPCEVPGVSGPARCGRLRVWENRETRKGRRIDVHFVVLPAPGPAPAKEAVVFFSGGPGEAATREAAYVALQLASAREGRDLLFVDLRGTGASN